MRKKYESPTMMAGFRQNIALANESNVDLQCHNAKGRVNDHAGDSPNGPKLSCSHLSTALIFILLDTQVQWETTLLLDAMQVVGRLTPQPWQLTISTPSLLGMIDLHQCQAKWRTILYSGWTTTIHRHRDFVAGPFAGLHTRCAHNSRIIRL
jgi:hypothetical protein